MPVSQKMSAVVYWLAWMVTCTGGQRGPGVEGVAVRVYVPAGAATV